MLPYAIYDVFTDTPYQGNPLAIVMEADGLSMPKGLSRASRDWTASASPASAAIRTASTRARVRSTPSWSKLFVV